MDLEDDVGEIVRLRLVDDLRRALNEIWDKGEELP